MTRAIALLALLFVGATGLPAQASDMAAHRALYVVVPMAMSHEVAGEGG